MKRQPILVQTSRNCPQSGIVAPRHVRRAEPGMWFSSSANYPVTDLNARSLANIIARGGALGLALGRARRPHL